MYVSLSVLHGSLDGYFQSECKIADGLNVSVISPFLLIALKITNTRQYLGQGICNT